MPIAIMIGLGLTSGAGGGLYPPTGFVFLTETINGVTYYLTETVAGATYYLVEHFNG